MIKKIAVIPGDGIGPEIVTEAVKVLDTVAEKFKVEFKYDYVKVGGSAIDEYGTPMPEGVLSILKNSDSVLLGAIGGPKWDHIKSELRPERALLAIRKELGLFANVRPAKPFSALMDACPLRPDIAGKGIDLVIVRELTGGIYFGKRGTSTGAGGKQAYDTMAYSEQEIERIGRLAFDMAKKRRKKLTSVDKANVLDTSKLWREVMHGLRDENPDIAYSEMYVDNCSMQLIRDPSQFDVIVTENMFGDILSDEASMLTGSIGMIPSMSCGYGSRALYEPIHGTAPDIAGQNIANPIATILSAAMLLKYSFNMDEASEAVEQAVEKVLNYGFATKDIMQCGRTCLTCTEMGEIIRKNI